MLSVTESRNLDGKIHTWSTLRIYEGGMTCTSFERVAVQSIVESLLWLNKAGRITPTTRLQPQLPPSITWFEAITNPRLRQDIAWGAFIGLKFFS
jgi:hypothetical protein